jgi:hypothetical protein
VRARFRTRHAGRLEGLPGGEEQHREHDPI